MSATSWLVTAAFAHLLSIGAVVVVLRRANIYTIRQLVLQSVVALLLPLVGVIILLAMARDALAEPPKPKESRFDIEPYSQG